MSIDTQAIDAEPKADPATAAIKELTAEATKIVERVARRQSDLRNDLDGMLRAIDREIIQRQQRNGALWAIASAAEAALESAFAGHEITKSAAPDAAERLLELASERVMRSQKRQADAMHEIGKLAYEAASGDEHDEHDDLTELRPRLAEIATTWKPAPDTKTDDIPF